MEFDEQMDPGIFHDAFMGQLSEHYDSAWTIVVGDRPIGFTFGLQILDDLLLGDTLWLPWATPLQKVTSSVRFLNSLRKTINGVMEAKTEEHKRFLEHLCKYGIARRIGTKHTISGEKAAVFQTKPVGA